jgi:hypothetical protein
MVGSFIEFAGAVKAVKKVPRSENRSQESGFSPEDWPETPAHLKYGNGGSMKRRFYGSPGS